MHIKTTFLCSPALPQDYLEPFLNQKDKRFEKCGCLRSVVHIMRTGPLFTRVAFLLASLKQLWSYISK